MKNNSCKKLAAFFKESKSRSLEQQLIKRIKEGCKNDEFKMHLQFIVDSKTKQIVSAEALSRWETSHGEIIFPGAYISLMEKSGLIVTFDYLMFEKACQKLAEWKGSDFDGVTISCNITRITISEATFADKISAIADHYDFDRSKLTIEITEDAIIENPTVAKSNMLKMKELGFTIALDDVGSGYASLISLCEYPIDIAKIDRSVLLLADTERGKNLFLGILSLIHSLNLKTVCEGVETEEQNSLVRGSCCDYIQGWYYSRALPQSKAEAFFCDYNRKL